MGLSLKQKSLDKADNLGYTAHSFLFVKGADVRMSVLMVIEF